MATLPTNRTSANTVAEHVSDHNTIHGLWNTLTTKGDVLGASAAQTYGRLAIGTDGQVLTADAASTLGFKWAAQSGTTGLPKVIAEQTLGSAAANIEFSAIPATYKHLRIEGRLRSTEASVSQGYVSVRVGHGSIDTGATNYRAVALVTGGAVGAVASNIDYQSSGRAEFIPGKCLAATADADAWGYISLDIEDYLTTTYWRVMRADMYAHAVTAISEFWKGQGAWKNKADTIDVVRLFPTGGSNFITGSQLRLIGIPAP